MDQYTITAQQGAFFTKLGFLELEMPHPKAEGPWARDLWRRDPLLQKFLTRTVAPLVLSLTRKKQLLLACDQWFDKEHRPEEPTPLKEMISLQGLCLGLAFSPHAEAAPRRKDLGLIPAPKTGHVLFFRPDLLLDWAHLIGDVYMALYGPLNTVYVHNDKDPLTNWLKPLGYHFGDTLKQGLHPIVQ